MSTQTTPLSRPRRIRSTRCKTVSSLEGFMDGPVASPASSAPSSPSMSSIGYSSLSNLPTLQDDKFSLNPSEPEKMTLRAMTRSLRKAKRQLLLRSVEQEKTSVDKFREIIMKITQDTDDLSLSSEGSFGNPSQE